MNYITRTITISTCDGYYYSAETKKIEVETIHLYEDARHMAKESLLRALQRITKKLYVDAECNLVETAVYKVKLDDFVNAASSVKSLSLNEVDRPIRC